MSVCARTAHGGGLVGLEFFSSQCKCLFVKGFLRSFPYDGVRRRLGEKDCKSEYFDFDRLGFKDCENRGGIGEVVKLASSTTNVE